MPSYITTWEPWYLSSGRCNYCLIGGTRNPLSQEYLSFPGERSRGPQSVSSPSRRRTESSAHFESVAESFLVGSYKVEEEGLCNPRKWAPALAVLISSCNGSRAEVP